MKKKMMMMSGKEREPDEKQPSTDRDDWAREEEEERKERREKQRRKRSLAEFAGEVSTKLEEYKLSPEEVAEAMNMKEVSDRLRKSKEEPTSQDDPVNNSVYLKQHDDPSDIESNLENDRRIQGGELVFSEIDHIPMEIASVYNAQRNFQKDLENIGNLPIDSIAKFQYHVTALQEEIGELLKADKRWKTHRNERYEKAEKLDEFADVYITLMNIALYSDFSSEDIEKAIVKKITTNVNRINSKK